MCLIVVWIFTLLYVAALFLLLVGTFGLFVNEKDPLSGIVLLPLGLPGALIVHVAPEPSWPWLAGLAPAINLGLLVVLCRYLRQSKIFTSPSK